MTRVVLVSCSDCRYYESGANSRPCGHCGKHDVDRCAYLTVGTNRLGRELPDEDVIPEWCPMREKVQP